MGKGRKSGNSAHANRQRSLRDLEWTRRLEEEEKAHKEEMKKLEEEGHRIREDLLDVQQKLSAFDEFVPLAQHNKKVKSLERRVEEAKRIKENVKSSLPDKTIKLLKQVAELKNDNDNLKITLRVLTQLVGEENYHQGSSGVVAIGDHTPIKCRLCSRVVPFGETFSAKPLIEDSGRCCKHCLPKLEICGVFPKNSGVLDPETDGACVWTTEDPDAQECMNPTDYSDVDIRHDESMNAFIIENTGAPAYKKEKVAETFEGLSEDDC